MIRNHESQSVADEFSFGFWHVEVVDGTENINAEVVLFGWRDDRWQGTICNPALNLSIWL